MTYEHWRSAFLSAVDQDLYPAEWLDRKVASGRARFWGNARGAILAEIRQYPSGAKEVHGLVAAGDVGAIIALIPLAEQWGRDKGCFRAVIESRLAWARVLPDYEAHQLSLRKEL